VAQDRLNRQDWRPRIEQEPRAGVPELMGRDPHPAPLGIRLEPLSAVPRRQGRGAINNDSKSPVFDQVDQGIVDDCREFVPVLIERLNNWRI
jgi:hypothetical protein